MNFRSNASKLLTDAEAVNKSLNDTQEAQAEAEKAINKAYKDYETTLNILNEVSSLKKNIYK